MKIDWAKAANIFGAYLIGESRADNENQRHIERNNAYVKSMGEKQKELYDYEAERKRDAEVAKIFGESMVGAGEDVPTQYTHLAITGKEADPAAVQSGLIKAGGNPQETWTAIYQRAQQASEQMRGMGVYASPQDLIAGMLIKNGQNQKDAVKAAQAVQKMYLNLLEAQGKADITLGSKKAYKNYATGVDIDNAGKIAGAKVKGEADVLGMTPQQVFEKKHQSKGAGISPELKQAQDELKDANNKLFKIQQGEAMLDPSAAASLTAQQKERAVAAQEKINKLLQSPVPQAQKAPTPSSPPTGEVPRQAKDGKWYIKKQDGYYQVKPPDQTSMVNPYNYGVPTDEEDDQDEDA